MLRSLFRGPKTVRVPVNNGQVEFKQVQVTSKTRSLAGRFFTTVIITYCVANTISWVASGDFKKRTEDARSRGGELQEDQNKTRSGTQQSAHWKKQHADITKTSVLHASNIPADDSDIVHFSLPIWFRRRERKPYSMDDRAWQDAKELIGDPNKVAMIQEKTVKTVMVSFKKNPQIMQNLHYIQFDGRVAVQFDVAPPMYQPVTYEIPSISVKPDRIDFGWRPLSQSNGGRVERTFHPAVFARASWEALKAFTLTTIAITASRLRNASSGPSQLRVKVSSQKTTTTQLTASQSDTGQSRPLAGETPSTQAASAETSKTLGLLQPAGHVLSWKAHQARTQFMTYPEALAKARKVFVQEWITRQALAVTRQTPGLCTVVGSITFLGAKGRYRVHVMAFYSPTEKAFVGLPSVTNRILVLDLLQMDTAERQKRASQLPTRAKRLSDPVPGNQAVHPTSPDEAGRPPAKGKDVGK